MFQLLLQKVTFYKSVVYHRMLTLYHVCVCVCVCVLYSFSICLGLCMHHHSEDAEEFQHH